MAAARRAGKRSLGRPELATVVLAVIRGLLRDLDATGDTARTDRAFLIAALAAHGAGAGSGRSETTPPSNPHTDGIAITPTVMRRKMIPAP